MVQVLMVFIRNTRPSRMKTTLQMMYKINLMDGFMDGLQNIYMLDIC